MNHSNKRSSEDVPCESGSVKSAKISPVEMELHDNSVSSMPFDVAGENGRPVAQLREEAEIVPLRLGQDHLPFQAGVIARNELAPTMSLGMSTGLTRSVTPCIGSIRQHNDEGMYFYTNALPLSETLDGLTRAATMLYNEAQAHVINGDYAEALNWFGLAMGRLNSTCPSVAMTAMNMHHNLGYCLYRLGRNQEAMLSYQRALLVAQAAHLGKHHVATANNAVAVLLFHGDASNGSKAVMLLQECLVVYQEVLGCKSKEAATVLHNIARVYYVSGHCFQALTCFEQCLSIRVQELGYDSIDVAATICNIGQTYHRLGSLNMALQRYQEFLKLAEVSLGSRHRDVALVLQYTAEILHEQGALPEAKAMYERALELGQAIFGKENPEVASILNKLGCLHYELQDLEAALQCYTEGLKIERTVFDSCHPYIMVTLMNMAQIHRHRGCFATALNLCSQLRTLQLQAYGQDSLEVSRTLSYMGLIHLQRKDFASALDFYEEALRIQLAGAASDGSTEIASTLNSIGLVVFNQGLYNLAYTCFTDSLRMKLKILGPIHHDISILWYNIATVQLERGEDDAAIAFYKEALRVEKNALGGDDRGVVLALQHLGIVYQGRGQLIEALAYFTQALDIERAKKDADNNNGQLVAKLLNLIGNIHLQRADVGKMMECYTEASRLNIASNIEGDVLIIAGFNFYGLSRLCPLCAPVA